MPERTQYKDTGCDLAPACLSCPFPQCRYDVDIVRGRMPHPWQLRSEALAVELIELRRKGATIDELAAAANRTRRQVFRLLAKERVV